MIIVKYLQNQVFKYTWLTNILNIYLNMFLSQIERSKNFIDEVKQVVSNIDIDAPVVWYISNVDAEIRKLIANSWIDDSSVLEREYMSFRRKLLWAMRIGKIESFSDVSSFLVDFWASPIPESLESQTVEIAGIDEDFWKNSLVEAPPEWVIYRWWTARKVLREYLGLEIHSADTNTDIDAFIWPDEDIDKVRRYFSCDAEWLTRLSDISDSTLIQRCKHVDLGMNQVIVSANTIYYTSKSEIALRTGISEVLEEPDNLFWVKQYKDESWRVIFTNQKLYRVLSMLVRWKLQAVKVRTDNIAFENRDAIGWMEKYLIITLKKIISEAWDDDEYLQLMMYRYSDLLLQMWYISKHEDIFTLLWDTHKQWPVKVYDSYMEKDFDDNGKRDMLWRLDKLTRVLVRKIIPETLEWFSFDPKNSVIELWVNYSQLGSFESIFKTHWDSFHERIKSQDQEK